MTLIDWLIVLIPVLGIIGVSCYCKRYVRGVADFLAAGRICGRYVISIGEVATLLSIIGLVAYVEVQYKIGFALSFWSYMMLPLGMVMGLTGFCTYRFRATKAMSLGQFLEMRYSRSFRVFAAALRSLSEMLANMIMPAIAARFFIYFLDLPAAVNVFGLRLDTFILLIIVILFVAVFIICMGGTLALVISDSIQGFLCYPLLLLLIVFVLCKFSWSGEIIPVMADRVAGESFLNPFDIKNLRDFNLFMIGLLFVVAVFHRASWIGAGMTGAAKSPHEQKMAGILGTWRGAIVMLFYLLVTVTVIVVMNHRNYAPEAKSVRDRISARIVSELYAGAPEETAAITRQLTAVSEQHHVIGRDAPMSQQKNQDTAYMEAARKAMAGDGQSDGTVKFQQYRALYHQTMMSETMRQLLPPVMLGLFCLLMIMAMISTDSSRIFSAALTIAQDIILPLRKRGFTPRGHIWLLRWMSIGVGVFFVFGSVFMSQLDYINMFVTLMTMMWLGGCGPVMIFGLYGRFGTTAGAWASLISGMVLALWGIFMQNCWTSVIYPFLTRQGMVEAVGGMLETVSGPFHPWVVWKMDDAKFPINSYELYFITMAVTLAIYCAVSWATRKEPFNLDRMLHRGIYNTDGMETPKFDWRPAKIFNSLIGITSEYTRGDRIISRGMFFYTFLYQFGLCFVAVILWNAVSPWPIEWWSAYFFITALAVPLVLVLFTTVWFGVGGIIDLKKMFRDLRAREDDPLDDGRVDGHVSLADKAVFEKAEHRTED